MLMWHCASHGVSKPRWSKTRSGRRAYCDKCSLEACRDYRQFKGGGTKDSDRARRWYVANREKKLAYEKAKRLTLSPEKIQEIQARRARQKREQRADLKALDLGRKHANLDIRDPGKNSCSLLN